MKKIIVFVIIMLLVPIIFLSIIALNKYHKDDIVIDRTIEQELLKEKYNKKQELDKIKEENKEKIEEYLKVKSWNEEITSYFD